MGSSLYPAIFQHQNLKRYMLSSVLFFMPVEWSDWYFLLAKSGNTVERYAADLPDDLSPCCYQLGVGLNRSNAQVEPMYVGKAKHFKRRMYQHIGKNSNIQCFIDAIGDRNALFCRYVDSFEDYSNLERTLLNQRYPWNTKRNNQLQYQDCTYMVVCGDDCGWHEFRNDRRRKVCPSCRCSEVDYDWNDIFVGYQYRAYCDDCNFVEWRDDMRRRCCPKCRGEIQYHEINRYEY